MEQELQSTDDGGGFDDLQHGIAALLEEARRHAARTVNAVMTATY